MKRRTFIELLAGAAVALGLPRAAPAEPANAIPNPDTFHSMGAYTHINNTGDYHGLSVYGNGEGGLWILDPKCPRDTVYILSGANDDSQMWRAFTRLEFEQQKFWPRQSPIIGLSAEVDDAL